MAKYVEYKYHEDLFDRPSARDIRRIDSFDILTMDIPEDAIGFNFIEAASSTHAAKVKVNNVKMYFLADPEEVFTTQQIRDHGPDHTIAIDDLNREFNEKLPPDAKSETTSDNIDNMLANFLSPSSPGQMMMDMMADSFENFGCHRVIGQPPIHCIGVQDSATILDKKTRAIISFPYDMR